MLVTKIKSVQYIHKLKSYGIDGVLLQWIEIFLAGRSPCTRVGDYCSPFERICSDVVQGSCLGPSLFLIFINNIVDCYGNSVACKLYADEWDDVKLFTELRSTDDNFCLQECLDNNNNNNSLY